MTEAPPPTQTDDDAIRTLVGQLELGRYKAAIKGLTQFGDRRQGTDRNRAAVAWLEAQLRSYGYANTARIRYDYSPQTTRRSSGLLARGRDGAAGGGRLRGTRMPTTVNIDPLKQPDAALRTLNEQPTTPGEREEVYCTKVGDVHPDRMYLITAHMDGHGWGEAANDDGPGSAIVLELARIFASPEVHTDCSIRFIFWNNEETGLNGARAYVDQRAALQGIEDPAGSGQYPEPRWLGVIQHDMMLFDHGMPRADGSVSTTQRAEADVNVEFQQTAKYAAGAQQLAWSLVAANEAFATDYPAAVGPHMTNTDSVPFMDLCPAISVRENERGREIGAGWDPHWHQPTDVFTTFSDADFRLGLNAAQTTLGAVARLSGVHIAH